METARTYFADEGEAGGRMYDPVMSSFLSVDRYVQNPSNSQNFNRYSYCLNNPLKYVDPSGWQMIGGNTPKIYGWGLGCHVALEPRDFRDGSTFMMDWALYGGGDEVFVRSGVAGSYGYTVANDPHYINNNFYIDRSPVLRPKTNFELIRDWHNNPCA